MIDDVPIIIIASGGRRRDETNTDPDRRLCFSIDEQPPVTMTRWLVKIGLLLLPAIATSLHLSRRSAVSLLVTAPPAAVFASVTADAAKADLVGQVQLNSKNKKTFPLASFGLQIYDDDTAFRLTLMALEVGYRNFFASVLAGNQKGFARVSSLIT